MSRRFTIAQAARLLDMSERTLRRYVAGGKIKAVKDTSPETGTAWFLEAATIEALRGRDVKVEEEPKDVLDATDDEPMPEVLAFLIKRLDALLNRHVELEERVAAIERELELERQRQSRDLTLLRARWPFGKR